MAVKFKIMIISRFITYYIFVSCFRPQRQRRQRRRCRPSTMRRKRRGWWKTWRLQQRRRREQECGQELWDLSVATRISSSRWSDGDSNNITRLPPQPAPHPLRPPSALLRQAGAPALSLTRPRTIRTHASSADAISSRRKPQPQSHRKSRPPKPGFLHLGAGSFSVISNINKMTFTNMWYILKSMIHSPCLLNILKGL